MPEKFNARETLRERLSAISLVLSRVSGDFTIKSGERRDVMYMIGGGLGNHHPMRDLTHNVGLCTKMLAHEYEKNKSPISDKERKLGYAAIIFLIMVIACIISLFILL